MENDPKRPALIFRREALPRDGRGRSASEELTDSLAEVDSILRNDAAEERAQRNFEEQRRAWSSATGAEGTIPAAPALGGGSGAALGGSPFAGLGEQPRAAAAAALPGAKALQRLSVRRRRRHLALAWLAACAGLAIVAGEVGLVAWGLSSVLAPPLAPGAAQPAPAAASPSLAEGEPDGAGVGQAAAGPAETAPDGGVDEAAPAAAPRPAARRPRQRSRQSRRAPSRRRRGGARPRSLDDIDQLLKGL